MASAAKPSAITRAVSGNGSSSDVEPVGGGIQLAYSGQRPPWQIVRRVQPRRQKIEKKFCLGTEEQQSENLLVEGENLQAMVSLYKYRGQVDLVITDPPYNTGQDFRYNDKWDEDPNDPDLGELVPADDGSRHSKWLRFMTPRLWMMREILKPGGVLAICIDHRELFRLGMLLDQIFGEENRLGIINWQKTSVKNDAKHLATTTEYVLVYAKTLELAKTGLFERTEKSNARFANPDGDQRGVWKQGDLSARGDTTHPTMVYAIQSPFDGSLHYPPEGRHWASEKPTMKKWLEGWGASYVERDLNDGRPKALVLRDGVLPTEKGFSEDHAGLKKARQQAEKRLKEGNWPPLYFGRDGKGKPVSKVHLANVKAGYVPETFWSDDDGELTQFEIDTVSWPYGQTGRSREGITELDQLLGKDHGFETVKPLRLIRKLISLWCPPSGIVLDPFAGSGTTGHAVLELNKETGASRRFILIEQGRPDKGDPYARALTYERLRRAIQGLRYNEAGELKESAERLSGGFRFVQLSKAVDADAVLALEREEMVDLLLTSHWDQPERAAAHLRRVPSEKNAYIFATSSKGEGYFLVWNGPGKHSSLDRETFRAIAQEAKDRSLRAPYHVYARICTYSGPNIEFYQIPNRILEKLGFNEASHPYSDVEAGA